MALYKEIIKNCFRSLRYESTNSNDYNDDSDDCNKI